MNELASRFCILQRRFVEFSERVPMLLRTWLSNQQTNFAEFPLDGLARHLFSLDSAAPPWLACIARCALEDQLSCVPYTKYGDSGNDTVVFCHIPATLAVEWPRCPSRTCAIGGRLTHDAAALQRRNSLLEVRVRELEARSLGSSSAALSHPSPRPITKATKTTKATHGRGGDHDDDDDSIEGTHAFLLEKRFEAEDAIAMLIRVQDEFEGRRRVLETLAKDQTRRFAEQRRSDARRARHELALAMEELTRLRAEVAHLRDAQGIQQQAEKAVAVVDSCPVVPKRALKLAGFWGVSHNDVLRITPHLVERFERVAGKRVAQPKDSQVCFPAKDQRVLIDVVLEVMAEHLPGYERVG
jgi:hypothetical protein